MINIINKIIGSNTSNNSIFGSSRNNKNRKRVKQINDLAKDPENRSKPREKTRAPKALKVTDKEELEKLMRLKEMPREKPLELFCPLRKAKIYCHSILVDKLGGLTKFIVTSLHANRSIDEICDLTQMGDLTISEEIEYLIRNGLIDADEKTLTPRGHQYGELLTAFDSLSEGIEVSFNEFANIFEDSEPGCELVPEEHILPKNWNYTLTRNDNYANSLAIALDHINPDMPFCAEILESLYTTVWIDCHERHFKRLQITDFTKGMSLVEEPCVEVAIPCDRVSYKPRYEWVNRYRNVLAALKAVSEEFADELLTDKARCLLGAAKEEDEANDLMAVIDTVTGSIYRTEDDMTEALINGEAIRMERSPLEASLECDGIILEEIEREELYRTVYFPYREMEAC